MPVHNEHILVLVASIPSPSRHKTITPSILRTSKATNQTLCPVATFLIQYAQGKKKIHRPPGLPSALYRTYHHHHLTPIVPSNPRKPKKSLRETAAEVTRTRLTSSFLLRRIDQPSAQAPTNKASIATCWLIPPHALIFFFLVLSCC